MATGQSILDRMELLHQELQLQETEADVTRGLLAANVAQDYFESVVAQEPEVLGGQVGTITTTSDAEATAYPSGVLRIDRLQYIDPVTSRPVWELNSLKQTGGHIYRRGWPYYVTQSSASTGKPRAYWTNGTNIYWEPLPDDTHTVRWYGFKTADDITATGTFAYPDIVMLPLATFAAMLLREGLQDESSNLAGLAENTFRPVVRTLSRFNRDGAQGLVYTQQHEA